MILVYAEDAQGNQYDVENTLIKVSNALLNISKRVVPQRVTVVPLTCDGKTIRRGIKKGQYWSDPSFWQGEFFGALNMEIHGDKDWKITKLEETDDEKIVTFKMVNPRGVLKRAERYKELLEELDLSDQKVRLLVKDALVHVFPAELLKELACKNDLQFIIDDYWMYLKADKTAYRV